MAFLDGAGVTKLVSILKTKFQEKSADWVVEQGTKGSWSYRKWYSGKIEAWTRWNVGTVAITTASPPYGGYRSGELATTIPSGIFTSAPRAVGIKTYSQGGWLTLLRASSATSISAYMGCAQSMTITNQTIDIYAWQDR